MHQSLRGYTTALLADVARDAVGEQIADDINAVAHLVSRTNDLAVALTDFAVSTAARRAVLEDLLTDAGPPAGAQDRAADRRDRAGGGVPHRAPRAVRAGSPHARPGSRGTPRRGADRQSDGMA